MNETFEQMRDEIAAGELAAIQAMARQARHDDEDGE